MSKQDMNVTVNSWTLDQGVSQNSTHATDEQWAQIGNSTAAQPAPECTCDSEAPEMRGPYYHKPECPLAQPAPESRLEAEVAAWKKVAQEQLKTAKQYDDRCIDLKAEVAALREQLAHRDRELEAVIGERNALRVKAELADRAVSFAKHLNLISRGNPTFGRIARDWLADYDATQKAQP